MVSLEEWLSPGYMANGPRREGVHGLFGWDDAARNGRSPRNLEDYPPAIRQAYGGVGLRAAEAGEQAAAPTPAGAEITAVSHPGLDIAAIREQVDTALDFGGVPPDRYAYEEYE